ncbi:hypothetical protein BB560_003926, partial [Smittium megazygosporum]
MDISEEQEKIDKLNQEILNAEKEIKAIERRKNRLILKRKTFEDSILQKQKRITLEKNAQLKNKFDDESFPWSKDLKQTAAQVFGIHEWKFSQIQVMNSILSKRDVFVIMPTGTYNKDKKKGTYSGGKSLCYQLTSLICPGLTVVISPLISLIQDQVFELTRLGINAKSLTSYNHPSENTEILGTLRKFAKSPESEPNPIKLLYLTPERLLKGKRVVSVFESLYAKNLINCFVIDECHCCSEYGHDFRPDYKKLGLLRILFQKVPIMALTATSTNNVKKSVIST